MSGARDDLARASMLLDLRRYGEAAGLLASIIAAEPADSRAWCLLAAAQLGNSQYQEAAAAASRAITLAPADNWPYRLASTAQRHLGNITAALTAANEACKLAPDEWRAYTCLAQALLATEVDFKAAERAAATALRLAPDEPDAHFIAGKVSYAREEWRKARAHQERALGLNPAHSGALNELGRIGLHDGGHARAAQHFVQAAQSAPGVSTYRQNVELVVRRLITRTIYAASIGSLLLMYLTTIRPTRGPIVIGYAVIVALSAGFGAIQLRRMPPQIRPLFRTRRVRLALAVAYGSILIAVAVAAATPADALSGAILAVTALIITSRLAAVAILRPNKTSTAGRKVTP
jgi:tetratricopeptide (TPR) repeat protein